jgi:uncharacterized protein (TIGR02246 family)
MTTTDAHSIATTIADTLQRGWNSANGELFASVFTDDCDFVDIRGDHHRGRIANAKGHQAILDTVYRGSQMKYEVLAARETKGVVVAHLLGTMTGNTPLPPNNGSIATLILVRDGDAWRVAAFHNTLRLAR